MSLREIGPEDARTLLDRGAVLVDVREPDEHARARIPGSRNLPISALDDETLTLATGQSVIFHCRSGARTAANAGRLAGKVPRHEAYVLAGGLEAWRAAGLPVTDDRRQPIELQRQVQIGAGGMVLAGTLLGWFFAPEFLVVPAFVGSGLVFAGMTGFCGLARLLMLAPWNRQRAGRTEGGPAAEVVSGARKV